MKLDELEKVWKKLKEEQDTTYFLLEEAKKELSHAEIYVLASWRRNVEEAAEVYRRCIQQERIFRRRVLAARRRAAKKRGKPNV